MIHVSDVTKSYQRRRVLDSVHFEVREGSITAVMGHNGSGKTTLIKILLGLVRPDSGHVSIDGLPVDGDCAYRSRIGYMPQAASFPGHLTVSEVVRLLIDLRASSAPLDFELYESFGLQTEESTAIRLLSGGTRQKLSASLATLFRPSVLVLDEPTASLDPIAATTLKRKLGRLRDEGTTILVSSHIASEVETLCEALVLLNDGSVAFQGKTELLKSMSESSNLEGAVAARMRALQALPAAQTGITHPLQPCQRYS